MATLASASGSIVRSPRRPITTFSILPVILSPDFVSSQMKIYFAIGCSTFGCCSQNFNHPTIIKERYRYFPSYSLSAPTIKGSKYDKKSES
jgi:hypothetical protein